MGYKNRTIREDFDDLGDDCYIVIKNPKLLDMPSLTAKIDGVDEKNKAAVENASLSVLGSLVVAWLVWDTTWEPADGETEDDRPELPAPVADVGVPAYVMAKAPVEITNWIGEQMPGKSRQKKSSISF